MIGTAKCLSMTSILISVKYLGNTLLDSNLNLHDNFQIAYRKASGWLHLLLKMRRFLTTSAPMKIYEMVITPLLTCSSIISLKLLKIQSDELFSLETRSSHSVGK